MAAHGQAIRIRDTSLADITAQVGNATKRCSGCDPDVPGHVRRADCKVCHGSGREAFALLRIVEEMRAKPTKRGVDTYDENLYLEE